MADPWDSWDEQMKRTGQPHRVAEILTDVELLNLLAQDRGDRRHVEKELIKQELFDRLKGRD